MCRYSPASFNNFIHSTSQRLSFVLLFVRLRQCIEIRLIRNMHAFHCHIITSIITSISHQTIALHARIQGVRNRGDRRYLSLAHSMGLTVLALQGVFFSLVVRMRVFLLGVARGVLLEVPISWSVKRKVLQVSSDSVRLTVCDYRWSPCPCCSTCPGLA